MKSYFVSIILLVILNQVLSDQFVKIDTKSGPIHGKVNETPTGKLVNVFWGIPYAEPPVGKLRFRAPQEVKPWSELKDALSKPNACIQFVGPNVKHMKPNPWWREAPHKESEDCLYLNIWVPYPQPKKAAVMIWIHGGGYYSGHSTLERYDGQGLASEENVVVVSLNYRLSVLGFLYLGTPDIPGNVGLLDQTVAIKWVYDNIENFGGDNRKITVIGQSAGSVSAAFQLANLSRQGIVKKAILLSGTPMQKWTRITKNEALESASHLIKEAKCSENATIQCLRNLQLEDLREATLKVRAFRQIVWPPVIDEMFVPTTPDFVNANGVIFGETRMDGAHQLVRYASKLMAQKLTDDEMLEVTKNLIYNKDSHIAKMVQFYYTNWTAPDDLEETRKSLLKLATDAFMTCGNNEFGTLLKKQGVKSYRFIYDHVPTVSDWPNWFGSVHGDEIEFIFGGVLNPKRGYSKNEMKLSRKVMRSLANFAKTGNPNEANDGDPEARPEWPLYSRNRKFISIGLKETVGNNHRVKECSFWMNVIDVLSKSREKIGDGCHSKTS